MRLPSLVSSCLLVLCAAALSAQAERLPSPAQRPSGAPGTPTPQPFAQPLLRPVPSGAPQRPALLNDGTGYQGGRLNPPPAKPAPADGELPLLQEQRRRDALGLPGAGD